MNTRSEIEEERRLFYVALTRAEKQVYLSYAQSRYRWGKLIDCEPSRFLEEVDEKYLDYITPKKEDPMENRFIDKDIFGETPNTKIRFKKPTVRKPEKRSKPERAVKIAPPKNLKKVSSIDNTKANLFDNNLTVGNIVVHGKFGKGKVLQIEGIGNNRKAEIKFESGSTKNLLLQYARLKVIG